MRRRHLHEDSRRRARGNPHLHAASPEVFVLVNISLHLRLKLLGVGAGDGSTQGDMNGKQQLSFRLLKHMRHGQGLTLDTGGFPPQWKGKENHEKV